MKPLLIVYKVYDSDSPIIPLDQTWSPALDAASQQEWHQDLGQTLGKSVGQAAVYLSPPKWGTAELIPKIPNALSSIFSFSGHSYPQSACGGASTNLQALQSHPYGYLITCSNLVLIYS